MGRVTHFDVMVKDQPKASAFYKAVFGWETQGWDGPMEYWFLVSGSDSEPGINGGMGIGEPNFKEVMLTVEVDDLGQTIKTAIANGGAAGSEPRPIQGVGMFSDIVDCEGNKWGILQPDESAGS